VVRTPNERGILASKAYEGDDDVGKLNNESAIEVSKT